MRGDADATESRTSVPGLAGKDFREGNEASENRPDLLSFDQHQPNGTTARDADHVHNSGETAWTWLHKLRRAMVRPAPDRLKGWIEVDETMVGGLEEGVAGRQTESKVLVVIAAEADGPGIGRIRMRVIEDASAASLHPFVQYCVEPGSTLHTDGWQGYSGLDKKGYQREVTVLRGRRKEASTLMPRVHRIAGLLKRWRLGTHQGAVAPQHLSYYLDEFTFRFNRRKSKSRGKLFFRLTQQAANTSPKTYDTLIGGSKSEQRAAQQVGVG